MRPEREFSDACKKRRRKHPDRKKGARKQRHSMRVSAWDSVQPECRLAASHRQFLSRRHEAHISAVQHVKTSIDNHTPPKAMGANMVKVALRQEDIERTNQLLQTKLKNMHVPKIPRPAANVHVSMSTAASASMRPSGKAKLVARENSQMRRRLEGVKSGLRAVEQQKDFARHEKYLKQISRVKVAPAVASPVSPPSLVPLRNTNSSGWSDELWGTPSLQAGNM